MRRSRDRVAIGGWLCLLAMLAISSPGVRIVSADDAPPIGVTRVDPQTSGPVCSASGAGFVPGQDVAAVIEQWRRAAEAEARRGPDLTGDQPIALNNRGYNYRAASPMTPSRLLEQIQREQ